MVTAAIKNLNTTFTAAALREQVQGPAKVASVSRSAIFRGLAVLFPPLLLPLSGGDQTLAASVFPPAC